MIGQHCDEYVPVNTKFFLVKVGTQAKGTLQHFETSFGFEQCHVQSPQFIGLKLLIGSQDVVAAQTVGHFKSRVVSAKEALINNLYI